MKKIISITDLQKKIADYKNKKNTVVLCHGTFDLLHLGHLRHFVEAKKFGDILIVTVTSDKYVIKGPNRPFFSINQRLEALSYISEIDFVASVDSLDAVNLIRYLKPNIYCKGPDYKDFKNDLSGKIYQEIKSLKSVKGIFKTTKSETFSSSKLLNEHFKILETDQKSIIFNIKKKLKKNPSELINKLSDLKVLVIGEAIIDNYVYCDPIGKSGKDPILTFKKLNENFYLGGVLSIAKNISEFAKKVTIISSIGEKNEYKKLIKEDLKKNITCRFFNKKNSSTIVKTRYLDHTNYNKVFAIYNIDDNNFENKTNTKILSLIKNESKKHDIIIVSDYGHGFFSDSIVNYLNKINNFKALNTQINSSNLGYHGLNRYKNVDLLIINEREIRFELRDRNSELKLLIKKLAFQKSVKCLVVTMGSNGAIMYLKKHNAFYKCPAFAGKVIDKVGAGDAMLSLLSLAIKKDFDPNFSLLFGSLAAANNVESISNSVPCSKSVILKNLSSVLK